MATRPTSKSTRTKKASAEELSQAKSLAKDLAKALVEAKAEARAAGLVYVKAFTGKGYTRKGSGKNAKYVDAAGRALRAGDDLTRIRKLAIPPAYREVWVSANPRAHLQAVGRDARGRLQYRYHAQWRQHRDGEKFRRIFEFGRRLPAMRKRVEADLSLKGLPRERVLAAVVTLLDLTLIRIGNDEYARDNQSFGLTTLRNDHVDVRGAKLTFEFRGKSGVEHEIAVEDPRLAEVVRRCQGLPGEELFEYLDERGKSHDVLSDDVNRYLKEISGRDFTAKDFRTWAGTLLCLEQLRVAPPPTLKKQLKATVLSAIDHVAKRLGNTRAVCRKSYIHPVLLDGYMSGRLGLHRCRAPGHRVLLGLRGQLSELPGTGHSRPRGAR